MKSLTAIALLLAFKALASSAPVVQTCSIPGLLQQVEYTVAPYTRVCLLSEEALLAHLSLFDAWVGAGNFTTVPETSAVCANGAADIYVNQSGLTGRGSITFEDTKSGNAFELVYAPRGVYIVNRTVVKIVAGNQPPIEPLWISYGMSSWLLCEVADGGNLRDSVYGITYFSDEAGCVGPNIVTDRTTVKGIRLLFSNSSGVPLGNYTVLVADGKYSTCSAVLHAELGQSIQLTIYPATNGNDSNGTSPNVTTTHTVPPTHVTEYEVKVLVIVVVIVMVVIVMVVVVATCIAKRKNQKLTGKLSLDLSQIPTDEVKPVSLPQMQIVIVEKKDSEWVPLFSNELSRLHLSTCEALEFQDNFLFSKLEDQSCHQAYVVMQVPASSSGQSSSSQKDLVKNLTEGLPPDVVRTKLLVACFGTHEDHDSAGCGALREGVELKTICFPELLNTTTAKSCAEMAYNNHHRTRKPASLLPLGDGVCPQSNTSPTSATPFLEESKGSSPASSDQSTPEVTTKFFRPHLQSNTSPTSSTPFLEESEGSSPASSDQSTPEVTTKFFRPHPHKDQSLLLTVLLRNTAEKLSEVKHNTDYLVEEAQKGALALSDTVL